MNDIRCNWLVILLLADAPKLFRMCRLHKKFISRKLAFSLVKEGTFNAFYDWIASPSGVIIGVRYWVLGDELNGYCFSWHKLPYIRRTMHPDAYDIRFNCDLPECVPPRNDQCFGGDVIYKADQSELYALALDLYGLDQYDLVAGLRIIDLPELKETKDGSN